MRCRCGGEGSAAGAAAEAGRRCDNAHVKFEGVEAPESRAENSHASRLRSYICNVSLPKRHLRAAEAHRHLYTRGSAGITCGWRIPALTALRELVCPTTII